MTEQPTYQERVYRFRIFRHEELPTLHKIEMRKRGIDPDQLWKLIYSFADREAAEAALRECQQTAADWETYKLVDAGGEQTIERLAFL